jgi:hypothetical protein
MTRALAWFLVAALAGTPASAQTTALEVQESAGASSESTAGAGTQVRLFGEATAHLKYRIETAWGTRSHRPIPGQYGSDFLGTAYPYGNRLEVIEGYAEYFFAGRKIVQSIKAGRYRTPFGMSSASDHAYVGFLRPPLMRYGTYYGLSAGYLEHGVDVVVGTPRLSGEVSVGRPADVGDAIRRPGWNTVARGQVAIATAIIGVSGIDTTPYLPEMFASGRARFLGVDGRWMYGGVQIRGEWMDGKPFDGTITHGGYLDVFVHRPSLGPVTIVGRIDRLDYVAVAPYELYTRRYTAGARVRVAAGLAVSAGLTHQDRQLTQRRRTTFDAGVSYTLRKDF